MGAEAIAKLVLQDGREVWRVVLVRYRDVRSGKWVSAEEVEALLAPTKISAEEDLASKRSEILSVQAGIAADPAAGPHSTQAARLVLRALEGLSAERSAAPQPWWLLGRQLAGEVLRLLEKAGKQARKARSPAELRD